MSNKLTIEEFINRSNISNNYKYDYSKSQYINNKTKVCIICPIHGEFLQNASHHMNGVGCQKCSGKSRLTTDEFIKKASNIHNNKYDYSKVEYTNKSTKVIIICPEHGEFLQTPDDHANKPAGCPKCKSKKIIETHLYTQEQFLNKAILLHGTLYNYEKFKYIHNTKKGIIICSIHGEFEQSPKNHLQGKGCAKCGILKNKESQTYSKEKFLEDSIKIHGNKYTYNLENYNSYSSYIEIFCEKHGSFIQKALNHATMGQGCPRCYLKSQNKLFEKLQETFNEVIKLEASPEWLNSQRFDIYLPKYNIAIEYNGAQHYEPIDYFGGEEKFKLQQQRDELKREKCRLNNCSLFEIKYDYNDDDYDLLINNISKLIQKEILENTIDNIGILNT